LRATATGRKDKIRPGQGRYLPRPGRQPTTIDAGANPALAGERSGRRPASRICRRPASRISGCDYRSLLCGKGGAPCVCAFTGSPRKSAGSAGSKTSRVTPWGTSRVMVGCSGWATRHRLPPVVGPGTRWIPGPWGGAEMVSTGRGRLSLQAGAPVAPSSTGINKLPTRQTTSGSPPLCGRPNRTEGARRRSSSFGKHSDWLRGRPLASPEESIRSPLRAKAQDGLPGSLRKESPATLVDATTEAFWDAGSIPAGSTITHLKE